MRKICASLAVALHGDYFGFYKTPIFELMELVKATEDVYDDIHEAEREAAEEAAREAERRHNQA